MNIEDAERILGKLGIEPTHYDALGDLLKAVEKLIERIEALEAE